MLHRVADAGDLIVHGDGLFELFAKHVGSQMKVQHQVGGLLERRKKVDLLLIVEEEVVERTIGTLALLRSDDGDDVGRWVLGEVRKERKDGVQVQSDQQTIESVRLWKERR